MAKYKYIAKDTMGVETTNVIHAESAEAAVDYLHRDGLVVLSMRESRDSMATKLGTKSLFGAHVPTASVSLFTKQLSSMLHAGLPLIRALYSLAREEQHPTFANILVAVANDIESGEALSAAMAKHPAAFPRLYVSMIKSGEQSGTLDTIMEHLVRYMHRTENIKRKVKSALSYPVFVVGFAIIAFIVLLIKIVPMMSSIYEKLGAELPGPTKIVLAVSDFATSYFWLLVFVAIALVIAYRLLRRIPTGRVMLDKAKLKIPIFGKILEKVVVAKFLRTLGVLVVSGLPILESLELSGGASGNEVIERAAGKIAFLVSKGGSLSAGFHATGAFPETVVQMVSTGEETGKLGDMLASISDHYDEQVESSVEGLASVIEPLMIVIVGGLIAVMLVAMFLPVFHLGGAVRQAM
ncbi:MAG: type II secretion system F family protein [Candidatus Eisenbacteria bacterium]|nr:type II secretion system F family protein [Candidatus Eisenbacteria bacterium]